MSDNRKRIADAAFLLALMIYILSGVSVVPLHGDELMQISMARDVYYITHGQWDHFNFTLPVVPDSETDLRLINGTINKTLIGLTWLITGRDLAALPGIYVWANPMDWNQAQGNVATDDEIHLARIPSAIFTALGVILVFALGWKLRLRSLAYPAALIYALHPVILLNGRRAMMEGSLIFFTLLTMYWLVSMIVAQHSASDRSFMTRIPVALRYVLLGTFIGLTMASKQTGIVVAIPALIAAIGTQVMSRQSWRITVIHTLLVCVVGGAIWLGLNPGYWSHPLRALRYDLSARAELLTRQAKTDPTTYTSLADRFHALVSEPFLSPPQFYESSTWANIIDKQIGIYQQSSIDGWDWGPIIGVLLTGLAGIGLVTLIYDALHRDLVAGAIILWAGAALLFSLSIPFGWQRYYLPLTLVAIILAATGLGRLFVRRTAEQDNPERISLSRRDVPTKLETKFSEER